jgi:hypothetical protein
MVVMRGSPASHAAEEDVVGIVDKSRVDINHWIHAIVFFSFALFLCWGFSLSERRAAGSSFFAVLTARMIRSSGVFSSRNVDATAALQNKIILCDLRNEMLTPAPSPQTVLVIGEGTTLAINQLA